MKRLLACLSFMSLAACATFDRPADFALERYDGATPLEKMLSKVNLEENQARSCRLLSRCQPQLPGREEVEQAAFLDDQGKAMAKAYALQDAGVNAARMRLAGFDLPHGSHVVLVVDDRYVLDNFYDSVRPIADYQRFRPRFVAVPATLMAEGRRSPASVGR